MAETLGVDVQLLRYANCWEDADVLLRHLAPSAGNRVLSIASAGDNTFSLLPGSDLVVAVDISPVQLHLVELKAAAIRRLEREDFLAFYGFEASTTRWETYRGLRGELDAEARAYWDGEQERVEAGIFATGKFERYFRLFRTVILPFIHNQKTVAELFRAKTAAEQEAFYDRRWNSARWKFLFRFFFSRLIMGRLGRDPEFLKQVELGVSRFIFERAGDHLRSVDAQTNGFLRFIHTGTFADALPHYLRPENYPRIRDNLKALRLQLGYAQSALEGGQTFDRFNMSNIFEYMSAPVFQQVAKDLAAGGRPGARYSYWNLMVPRRLSEASSLRPAEGVPDGPIPGDKGFFYRRFCTEVKHV